jgi:sugar transferase (PEP-CTERM system associated)
MDLRTVFMLVSDALLALFALLAALILRFGGLTPPEEWGGPEGALKVCSIFVVATLFSSYLMEVYSLPRESRKRDIFITCLQAGCAGFFLLSVVYYLDPSVMLGRGILFISLGLFILLQFLWHALPVSGVHSTPFAQRVLILGTGDLACQLGGLLVSQSSNFELAGYLECDESSPSVTVHDRDQFRSQIVRKEGDLLQTAQLHRAAMIVVALAERRGVLPLQEMMRCKLSGIEVVDAPTFYELVQGKLMLEHMTPSWIIFSSGFHRTALINVYKRCFDILLSLTGLILSAPVFPLVALAIKLDSPGPLFFTQLRVGNGERPFLLYKFRSMRQDAEKNGAVWAVKNDSRVTAVGRFLRNSRIDEIPQLYNVLKGEMSFIGPRPERPEFVEGLKRDIYYYSKRHTIKPGLTGWAQVRYPYGATVEDAVEKLRYDLYYIKNLSFLLDTQILFETVKVVLFGRGR